jgi:hypothetical protein
MAIKFVILLKLDETNKDWEIQHSQMDACTQV